MHDGRDHFDGELPTRAEIDHSLLVATISDRLAEARAAGDGDSPASSKHEIELSDSDRRRLLRDLAYAQATAVHHLPVGADYVALGFIGAQKLVLAWGGRVFSERELNAAFTAVEALRNLCRAIVSLESIADAERVAERDSLPGPRTAERLSLPNRTERFASARGRVAA